jgi:hypothetical protein
MKESRHTKGERSSGSRPSHVIDVTDVRTTTARLYNTQRSASEPRLRELNQIRPATSFGSEASTPSQKARDLRKQLDQALKTSAAIRTTQERLGAELSNFKSKFQKQRESISPARSRGSPRGPARFSRDALASSPLVASLVPLPSPTATERTVVSGETPLANNPSDVPSEIHRPAMAITGNVVTTTPAIPANSIRLTNVSPTFEQAVNAFDKIVSDQRLKSVSPRVLHDDAVDEQRQPESPSSSRPTGVTTLSSPTSTRQSSERSPATTEYESSLSPTHNDTNKHRFQLAHVATRKKKAASPTSNSEATPFSSSTRRSVSEMSPIYYTIRESPKSPTKRTPAPNFDKLATLMDDDLTSEDDELFSSSGEMSAESKEGYAGTSIYSSHDDYYDDSFSDDDAVKMRQLESIINGLRTAEERQQVQQHNTASTAGKTKQKKATNVAKSNKTKSKKKK